MGIDIRFGVDSSHVPMHNALTVHSAIVSSHMSEQKAILWRKRNRRERLSPVKQRIYDFLRNRGADGATTRQIMDFVYMHDPDGGPESGNVISVHVRQMNLILVDLGKQIVSTRGPGATYHLEECLQ
jgi:hypothetical protein